MAKHVDRMSYRQCVAAFGDYESCLVYEWGGNMLDETEFLGDTISLAEGKELVARISKDYGVPITLDYGWPGEGGVTNPETGEITISPEFMKRGVILHESAHALLAEKGYDPHGGHWGKFPAMWAELLKRYGRIDEARIRELAKTPYGEVPIPKRVKLPKPKAEVK